MKLRNINYIGPYAIAIGLLYWPFEAALHAYFFDEGTFMNTLFEPEANELWMRSLTAVSFIFLGLFANMVQKQQTKLIARLKSQEARSRRILETAYDAYISIDSESKITGWNPQAEALFGWPRSTVLGESLVDIIIPEKFKQAHINGMIRYLETSNGPWLYRPVQTQALTKQGDEIRVEMAIIPLASGDAQEFFTFIRKVE